MRTSRIVGGLAVAAIASSTLTTSASAGAAKGDLRERFGDARSSAVSAQSLVTAQGGGCFDDPVGDARPSDFPRADLTQICVQHDGRSVSFSATPVQFTDPRTDPGWAGITGVAWGVDLGADGMPEFEVALVDGEFAVYDSADNLRCEATPTISATGYGGSFPVSCFGGASSLRVQAFMAYDSNPGDPDAEVYDDLTAWFGPVVGDTAGSQLRTSRLAGADRYATAVAISRRAFPDSAAVVYVARADAFADALAGGSLTDGPVLLVPSCGTVPAVVLAEVRRIAPSEVIALGGTGAVCDAVLAQVSRI